MDSPLYSVGSAIEAVQHGRLDDLMKAMENGISPKAADADGCSLLHWACINNRYEIAKFLIESGAEVNKCGGTLNETPIQWASRSDGYGFTHLVVLLLEKGATIDHKSTLGHDALFLAVQAANTNIAFILLALGGADANTMDTSGATPLLWLYKMKKFMSHDNMELIRLLLTFGADPTAVDAIDAKESSSCAETGYGNNCLHYTALAPSEYIDFAMLQTLVEKGGSSMMEAVNSDGKTALAIATAVGNSALMSFYADWRLYQSLPDSSVTVFTAMLILCTYLTLLLSPSRVVSVLVLSLLGLGYYQWGTQGCVGKRRSRVPHGFAWGTIITTYIAAMRYISQDGGIAQGMSPWALHALYVLLTCLEGTIAVSLYTTRLLRPAVLSKRTASRMKESLQRGLQYTPLSHADAQQEEIDCDKGEYDEHTTAHMAVFSQTASTAASEREAVASVRTLIYYGSKEGHENEGVVDEKLLKRALEGKRTVRPRARLCATCLQDKNLSPVMRNSGCFLADKFDTKTAYVHGPDIPVHYTTHCGQCDTCTIDLDHHCPFVDTCVGRGNRRMFLIFCFSASTGCLFAASLMLYKMYHFNPPCGAELSSLTKAGGESFLSWLLASVSVIVTMVYQQPEVPAAVLLAYLVGIWIMLIFGQQVALIASRTTTVETLNADRLYWRGASGTVKLRTKEGISYYETVSAGSGDGLLGMAREFASFMVTGQYHVSSRPTVRLTDQKIVREMRLRWVDHCFDSCCMRIKRIKSSFIRRLSHATGGGKNKIDGKIGGEDTLESKI